MIYCLLIHDSAPLFNNFSPPSWWALARQGAGLDQLTAAVQVGMVESLERILTSEQLFHAAESGDGTLGNVGMKVHEIDSQH